MGCCPANALAAAAAVVALRTEPECSDWCHLSPLKCAGFLFEDNTCKFCTPDNLDATCAAADSVKINGRTRQCFSNVCVACYDGLPVTIARGTSVYISQTCDYYNPYAEGDDHEGKGVYLNVTSSTMHNVNLVGPGTVHTELPIAVSGNFSATKGITFAQCARKSKAEAAVVVTQNSIVTVEGYVPPTHATVLLKVAPPQAGGRINVDANVKLMNNDQIDVAAVGAVALSHVTGSVKATCEDEKGYVIATELSTTKNRLSVAADTCNVVNVAALLNDFGSEYLAQFKNGPDNSAKPWSGAHILVITAAVLTVTTLVVHQTHFMPFFQHRTRLLTAR